LGWFRAGYPFRCPAGRQPAGRIGEADRVDCGPLPKL